MYPTYDLDECCLRRYSNPLCIYHTRPQSAEQSSMWVFAMLCVTQFTFQNVHTFSRRSLGDGQFEHFFPSFSI